MQDLTVAPLADLGRSTTILPPCRYRRAPPVALDLAEMGPSWRTWLENILVQTEPEFRAVTHHVFRRAVVVGQGTVITANGRIVREAALEFVVPGNVPDGLERDAAGPGYHLKPARYQVVTVPSLLAKRPWAQNFAHFLVDAAALVTLADRIALPAGWQIVITRFDDPALRAVARDILAVLAPGIPVVEHPDSEMWRFDELHYVSPVHFPAVWKRPESLAMLRSAMVRRTAARPAGVRRLFISRGPAASRKLDNEDDIVAVCAARGFAVVRPHLLSIDEQASLFREAAFVVGVKGAGMANLVFATAGATALILTPGDLPEPMFWDISAHVGVRYAEMAGRCTTALAQGRNSFVIDPGRFTTMLDRLLEAAATQAPTPDQASC